MKGFQLRLLSLLLLLSACAYAVEVTARIKGTVTDPTGAVLPNVTVTATNQDTGVKTTTTTLANGDYIFQKLPIGTYSVSAAAPGFIRFTATGIVLNIDQEYVLPPLRNGIGDRAADHPAADDQNVCLVHENRISKIERGK